MAKRGPSRFKEREVSRVVRAARAAGGVEQIEISANGTIVIRLKDGETRQVSGEDGSEWEEEIARLKARQSGR